MVFVSSSAGRILTACFHTTDRSFWDRLSQYLRLDFHGIVNKACEKLMDGWRLWAGWWISIWRLDIKGYIVVGASGVLGFVLSIAVKSSGASSFPLTKKSFSSSCLSSFSERVVPRCVVTFTGTSSETISSESVKDVDQESVFANGRARHHALILSIHHACSAVQFP